VLVQKQKWQMCECCGLKRSSYGLASKGQARWCGGCQAAEAAVQKKPTPKRQLTTRACVYCGIGSEQCGSTGDDDAAVQEQARTRTRRRTKEGMGRNEIFPLS
jgi:hypothetical protein